MLLLFMNSPAGLCRALSAPADSNSITDDDLHSPAGATPDFTPGAMARQLII